MQVVNSREEGKIKGPLICFHQYGEDDDIKNLFDTIKEFKKDKKIKYTHFPQKKVIYFNIPSVDVNDFSKIVRISRSKSSFKSSYNCNDNKEEFDKLNDQKDSFIKIKGIINDNGTFEVVFKSNLPQGLHIKASRRIFEAANVKFNRDKSISTSKPFRYDDNKEDLENSNIKTSNKIKNNKYIKTVKAIKNVDSETEDKDNDNHEEVEDTHDNHEEVEDTHDNHEEVEDTHDNHEEVEDSNDNHEEVDDTNDKCKEFKDTDDKYEEDKKVTNSIISEPKKKGRKPTTQIKRKA
jgi:hypothetical protein